MARSALKRVEWRLQNFDMFNYEIMPGVFLRVILWPNRAKYDQAKRRAGSHAFYQQARFKFFEKGGNWTTYQKTFGVIHLVDGDFTVGHFAHELQHFMMVWADWMQMDNEDAWEYFPTMVQNITDGFFAWLEEGKERRWLWTPWNEKDF